MRIIPLTNQQHCFTHGGCFWPKRKKKERRKTRINTKKCSAKTWRTRFNSNRICFRITNPKLNPITWFNAILVEISLRITFRRNSTRICAIFLLPYLFSVYFLFIFLFISCTLLFVAINECFRQPVCTNDLLLNGFLFDFFPPNQQMRMFSTIFRFYPDSDCDFDVIVYAQNTRFGKFKFVKPFTNRLNRL